VVIAAMEATDENLGDVLRERRLNAAEAQQVLRALVQAVAAIHAQGLVHGRMEPGSVLAVGETIKLRSDCLQLAGEDFVTRCGEDVHGLGRIVAQAMTGRIPASENDPVLQLLPEPMARAVRRALSGSARVAEIASILGLVIVPAAQPLEAKSETLPGPVAVRPPMPVASSVPTAAPAISSEPDAVSQAATARAKPQESAESSAAPVAQAAPKVIALPAAPARTEIPKLPKPTEPAISSAKEDSNHPDDEPERSTRRRSAPLVMALAAVLVVATLWAIYGLMHPEKAAGPAKQAAMPAAASAPPAMQNPAATAQRSGVATVALNTPGWRVVAYTYMREAQAEHKAAVIRQRFPQLTPGVFALHGTTPWLVTLGGVMSKADAIALRNKAVSLGLPRDTYAQNYR
jgi:eukaryotic-like serine/threonine-protein kinase